MSTETKIRTPTFRSSFVYLDKPRPGMNPGDKEKYSIVMLFRKDDPALAELKAACEAAAAKKWGNKRPKDVRSPFRDGDEKDLDGYAGMIYITASSEDAPGVVDQLKNALDPKKVYSGCYARATINFFAYDKAGNRGVSAGLQNVQFVKHGEPFGSKRRAEDDFDEIESEDEPAGVQAGAKASGSTEPNW